MYYASMLILSTVDTRPADAITSTEKLELARLICRSMEYYIRAVPGNMINRMAFPLRVAYGSLPPVCREEECAQGVGEVYSGYLAEDGMRRFDAGGNLCSLVDKSILGIQYRRMIFRLV
jgi:hypothetical protein